MGSLKMCKRYVTVGGWEHVGVSMVEHCWLVGQFTRERDQRGEGEVSQV
jgi:hypothetical protein